jgi:hypothetical protein
MGAFKEMIIDDVEFVDTNLQLFEDDSIQLKLIPEEKDLVHAIVKKRKIFNLYLRIPL